MVKWRLGIKKIERIQRARQTTCARNIATVEEFDKSQKTIFQPQYRVHLLIRGNYL